jgi:ribosomal protein S18 acetylase RimI-like enzyme
VPFRRTLKNLAARTEKGHLMNRSTSIVVVSEPAAQDSVREVVRAGLNEFNFKFSPTTNVVPLILAARNVDDAVIGGLVGEMRPGWGWLYVALLWIEEAYRIQGVGRQLLTTAEAEARRHGCRYVWLETISFQARGFYEKQGYTVFGVLEDYPPGHRRFYLRKNLAPE